MARLPVVGSDEGEWGELLNEYLRVSLNADGTLKTSAVNLSGGQGPAGLAGSKIYTGTAAPSVLHNDGDIYINTTTGQYFQQTAGAWGSAIGNLTGPTGADGSVTNDAASYYTDNYIAWGGGQSIGNGTTALSFATQNMVLGSNITINGSTISISANGTYLFSVSGIIQEYTYEDTFMNMSYTVGIREQIVGQSWTNVQPYPLLDHTAQFKTDGGVIVAETMSISQMVKVTNAPVNFNILLNLNNNGSSWLANQNINVIQLD